MQINYFIFMNILNLIKKEVLEKLKNYIFGLKNMVGKVNQCVVV